MPYSRGDDPRLCGIHTSETTLRTYFMRSIVRAAVVPSIASRYT